MVMETIYEERAVVFTGLSVDLASHSVGNGMR